MGGSVEKLLYSRRDTAEALSLSVRSIDYLITSGRPSARRVGGKILTPANAVRRFAREDHPDSVRTTVPEASKRAKADLCSSETVTGRFRPRSEGHEDAARLTANNRG